MAKQKQELPKFKVRRQELKKVSKSNKPEAYSDSFATCDATFSVEVKMPWGESVEDIEVKIDCGGAVHGDEDTIDLFIQMLEQARDNLVARRGEMTRYQFVRVRGGAK